MKLRTLFIFLLCSLFLNTGLFAQDGRNHTPEVVQAKADLLAKGQDLSGPCGAFAIVNLAATYIGHDAGLLSKPQGNNCQGFATDIIAFPNGQVFDVLKDSGVTNGPDWRETEASDAIARYRKPVDTGMTPAPVDPVPDDPNPEVVALTQRVNQLEQNAAQTLNDIQGLAAYVARLETLLGTAVDRVLALEARPVPIVPTGCSASINLGFGRISVACKLIQ